MKVWWGLPLPLSAPPATLPPPISVGPCARLAFAAPRLVEGVCGGEPRIGEATHPACLTQRALSTSSGARLRDMGPRHAMPTAAGKGEAASHSTAVLGTQELRLQVVHACHARVREPLVMPEPCVSRIPLRCGAFPCPAMQHCRKRSVRTLHANFFQERVDQPDASSRPAKGEDNRRNWHLQMCHVCILYARYGWIMTGRRRSSI